MKKNKFLLLLLIVTLVLVACAGVITPAPEAKPISTGTPISPPPPPEPADDTPDDVVIPIETGQIAGLVWHDMNRNGIQDEGEPGLAEADVFAQSMDGITNEAVKTDPDGFYQFVLPVGEYQIRFVSPAGYSLTIQDIGEENLDSDPAQADSLTETFTLTADSTDSHWDAGYILDTISYGPPGSTYPDPTGPNLEDFPFGYNPLTGLPVDDPSLLGIPAMSISVSNFPVTARPQAGLSFSPMIYEIYIGFGMTRFMTIYYGEFPKVETPVMGDCEVNDEIMDDTDFLLGNQVWHDENRNNLQDAKELGIPGICVSLIDFFTGSVLIETTTNSNGYYGFNVDGDGQYIIHVSLPDNYAFSEKDQDDNDYVDSDVYPASGDTNPIQMMNEKDLSRDAGMYVVLFPEPPQPEELAEEFGTIGDFVWLDYNENGIQDETEPGMSGIVVNLYDWEISTFIMTAVTDPWGYYNFAGLEDDKFYRVDVVAPTGYVFTGQIMGDDETKDSDVNGYGNSDTLKIHLDGGVDTSWDAGLIPIRAIGPVRSGRLPYKYINELFPGGCLVYAGKTASLQIPLCASVMNTPDGSEDINDNLFGFDQFETIARGLWVPTHGVNYSGNMFSYTPPAGGIPVDEFIMYYNAFNQTKWQADPFSGGWLRFNDIADESNIFYPSVDRLTGRQLIYNNVIVLFADHEVLNADGTVIDINISSGNFGKAWLFRDGLFYNIYWSTLADEWEIKTNQMRPIKFVDADLNPFPLHPGNTWVHFVTQNTCLKETPYSLNCAQPGDEIGQWYVRFFAP